MFSHIGEVCCKILAHASTLFKYIYVVIFSLFRKVYSKTWLHIISHSLIMCYCLASLEQNILLLVHTYKNTQPICFAYDDVHSVIR